MTISNDATTTSITGVIPNGQNSHKKIIITLAFLVGVGVFLAAGLTIITGNKAYEQLNKPLIKTLLTGESSPSNPFASLKKANP